MILFFFFDAQIHFQTHCYSVQSLSLGEKCNRLKKKKKKISNDSVALNLSVATHNYFS